MVISSTNLPPGIKHHHHPDRDILAWSNREITSNRTLLTILITVGLIFIGVTLYLAYHMIANFSQLASLEKIGLLVFLIVFFFIDIGILRSLQSRKWLEMIQITNNEVIIHRSGLIKPQTKRFQKKGLEHGLVALIFLKYRYNTTGATPLWGDDPGEEAIHSLNIIYADSNLGAAGENREVLAHWMGTEEKHQLFLIMQRILKERKWNIDFKVEYHP